MKKKGYTLAEALLAMAVIGIVAALMLPLANKYRPDEQKALFINTYDSIVEAVSVLASNEEIYPHTVEIGDGRYYDYSRAPFRNDYATTIIDGTQFTQGFVEKFCEAMAYTMHSGIHACPNGFTLINNVEIKTAPHKEIPNTIELTFDINPAEDSTNCVFINKDTCPKPDRFQMAVVANGYTAPLDQMSKYYLKTRSNWKKSGITPEEISALALPDYIPNIQYWSYKTDPSINQKDDE